MIVLLASLLTSIVALAIFAPVTALAASLLVVIARLATAAVSTALSASSEVVTELAANCVDVIPPEAILAPAISPSLKFNFA